ncbi:MAG: KH domain-containing protein [Candidatus Poribacteria bacterium]|nr:KH domain-containing protein [Candidatus Poribacteria bacterium]
MFKDLIEYIVKSLVDYPDEVVVREVTGETVVIIELTVTEEDLGKIIGRYGRTLKAIRSVLYTAGLQANKKVILELIDEPRPDGQIEE